MYAIVLHAHQKIDRIAYRHLLNMTDCRNSFPKLRNILYFEGNRGPDSTRLKKRQQSEQPWHFCNPFDETDTQIHELITGHYKELIVALRQQDPVRAGFEAAWLAHAVVDGLTPAHHYPYEKELQLLRGEDRRTRSGLLGRAYIKGENGLESFRRSLQLVGPRGLLTNHAMFEGGAYTIMAPLRLSRAKPSNEDLAAAKKHGVIGMFQRYAREVAALDLYERYILHGWTPKLARDIRRELAPRMVMMVTLAWYMALHEAGTIEGNA